MSNVYSIASYILTKLKKEEKITTIKLQKLCYYCQAWSLVWNSKPLFNEDFRAWANGPVCIELFNLHKNVFEIDKNFNFKNKEIFKLSSIEKKTVDSVLKSYGNKDGFFLMQLTHVEEPWIKARGKTEPGASCNKIISKDSMQQYYGGLCE